MFKGKSHKSDPDYGDTPKGSTTADSSSVVPADVPATGPDPDQPPVPLHTGSDAIAADLANMRAKIQALPDSEQKTALADELAKLEADLHATEHKHQIRETGIACPVCSKPATTPKLVSAAPGFFVCPQCSRKYEASVKDETDLTVVS